MRLPRFLLITGLITGICLVYVWQQTEIFRLAYQAQKRQAHFEDSLDKNTFLRYNIEQNVSLVRIGKEISRNDFHLPDIYRLVRLEYTPKILKLNNQAAKKESIISRLFGIKREAEARTINPSITLESLRQE